MELRKNLVSVIVFRRDDIMVMCPGADGSVGVGTVYKEWDGALAQPRRWSLGDMHRREQELEVGDSWEVGS